jgi:hypothetical protein
MNSFPEHTNPEGRKMNRFIETSSEVRTPAKHQQKASLSWLLLSAGTIVSILLIILIIAFSSSIREVMLSFFKDPNSPSYRPATETVEMQRMITQKEKNIIALQKKLDKLIPRNPFLIINTTENQFVLRNADSLIRKGICSTGSYVLLDAGSDQQWIFKTPRGMFKIQGKTESPIWRKPDWAFIEEGLPIPAQDAEERYESGVLGDYALFLGHGYMLHGTIYKRFLGMPVTHGCVRLGDEDLEVIYKNLQVNSKVFIY